MKIVSLNNIKGGPGKTTTAKNSAHILATIYGKRVLLVDNDKQGNLTEHFGLPKDEINTIADILLNDNFDISDAIYETRYQNLHMIGANMNLNYANLKIIKDSEREQNFILKKALERVRDRFDICIVDNAPDINVSVFNILVAAQEVIIPVNIDNYSFTGLENMLVQIEDAKEYNPNLQLKGCLVTKFTKNSIDAEGKEELISRGHPVFNTNIRHNKKISETTFNKKPILEHSPRCGPSQDYKNFVKECFGL